MRCDAMPQDEQESIELRARTLLALEKIRELKSEVSRRQREMEIRRREKVGQRLSGRERLPWAIRDSHRYRFLRRFQDCAEG